MSADRPITDRPDDVEVPPPGGRILGAADAVELNTDPPAGALPSDTDVQAERQPPEGSEPVAPAEGGEPAEPA